MKYIFYICLMIRFNFYQDKEFISLYERMSVYEKAEDSNVLYNLPTIVRIKLTNIPASYVKESLIYTAEKICENVQNIKTAYVGFDEITLLIINNNSQQWFNGNTQKIVSAISSIATYYFNDSAQSFNNRKKFHRLEVNVFNIPRHEVNNCFIWRQKDSMRKQLLEKAQQHFSQRDINRKSLAQVSAMLIEKTGHEIKINNGFCVNKEYLVLNSDNDLEKIKTTKWVMDEETPLFHEDKTYLSLLVKINDII